MPPAQFTAVCTNVRTLPPSLDGELLMRRTSCNVIKYDRRATSKLSSRQVLIRLDTAQNTASHVVYIAY
jgi:hypothetical protein